MYNSTRKVIIKNIQSIAGFLTATNSIKYQQNIRETYHKIDSFVGNYNMLKNIDYNSEVYHGESRFQYLERKNLLHDYLHQVIELKEKIIVPILEGYNFEVFDSVPDFSKTKYIATEKLAYEFEPSRFFKSGLFCGVINNDKTITIFQDTSIQRIKKDLFMSHLLTYVSIEVVTRLTSEGNWNFKYLSENYSYYTEYTLLGEFDLSKPFELID